MRLDRIQFQLGMIAGILLLFAHATASRAQDSAGGGTLPRDITGGAALIFRPPENPPVHAEPASGRGSAGGGKIASPARARPSKEQDRIIARGNAARSAAIPRYSEAEQEYRQAARLDPTDARAFAGLGNVYLDQGRFAEAVEQYKQAIKLKPDYTDALMPLGYSLVRLNRFADAIELYDATLNIEPDNPEIYNNLGFIYVHTEAYNAAIEACEKAIRLLGQTGEAFKQGYQTRNEVLSHAYKNLGNAYSGLKKYKEAAEALKQATVIEPKNAAAHFNLGLTLYTAGRYSEAIEAYKEVIKLRPTLAAAHFNLGLAYFAINDSTLAMAEYDTLKKLNPKMADQLYSMIKR
jgi:tetratricopeptide (TPR) repeat protein